MRLLMEGLQQLRPEGAEGAELAQAADSQLWATAALEPSHTGFMGKIALVAALSSRLRDGRMGSEASDLAWAIRLAASFSSEEGLGHLHRDAACRDWDDLVAAVTATCCKIFRNPDIAQVSALLPG
jgi:hypothetical protein